MNKKCQFCGAETPKQIENWCNGLCGRSKSDDLPQPNPSPIFIIDYKKVFKFKKNENNNSTIDSNCNDCTL